MTVNPSNHLFRMRLYAQHDGRCALCGEPVPFNEMHLDHITPRAWGGEDIEDNLQVTHASCNLSKRDRLNGERPPKPPKPAMRPRDPIPSAALNDDGPYMTMQGPDGIVLRFYSDNDVAGGAETLLEVHRQAALIRAARPIPAEPPD